MEEKEDGKHSSNPNYERKIYKGGGTQNKVSDESRDIDKEYVRDITNKQSIRLGDYLE